MNRINTTTASATTVMLCRTAIVLSGLAWLAANDGLAFSVAIVALLLTSLPGLLVRTTVLRDVTAASTAILLAAHIVLGMQLELYEVSRLYDKAMHALGSGAIAAILIIAINAYCSRQHITLPMSLLLLLVFAGTLCAGTLWEIFEFTIDRTGLFTAQRGLQDTMLDLLFDALGAMLAVTLFAALTWTKAF